MNGLQERSFFHVSDEPHGEEHLANYRAARALLRELAPWIRVMDALSDISFARAGLTDTPIPSISTAPEFVREGFPAWAYWCCGPRGRYVNRLLETPLVKVRMSGWLFYRLRARGFLHWGYNYWYKSQTRQMIDPYTVLDGMAWPSWAYGDCFQVYPARPAGRLAALGGVRGEPARPRAAAGSGWTRMTRSCSTSRTTPPSPRGGLDRPPPRRAAGPARRGRVGHAPRRRASGAHSAEALRSWRGGAPGSRHTPAQCFAEAAPAPCSPAPCPAR